LPFERNPCTLPIKNKGQKSWPHQQLQLQQRLTGNIKKRGAAGQGNQLTPDANKVKAS